jgi:hypothetical protein
MIFANKEVEARWDGKIISINPKNPLDLKKYGYSDKQISSIEQHFINKHEGLTNIAPVKVKEVVNEEVKVAEPEAPKNKGGRPKKE